MMNLKRRLLEIADLLSPKQSPAADRADDALDQLHQANQQLKRIRAASGNPVSDMITGVYRPARKRREA